MNEKEIDNVDKVTVGEVLNEVQTDIDNLQMSIDSKFKQRRDSLLIAKQTKNYFIVKNIFWDKWFQKLFAQFISVKIWVMILITVLLGIGLITNIQFVSILGIIMGLKGAFQVADVWHKSNNNDVIERSAMDKT